jgi:hypothetical protein
MLLQDITLDYLLKTLPVDVIDKLREASITRNKTYRLSDFVEVPEKPIGEGAYAICSKRGDKWVYHGLHAEPIAMEFLFEKSEWYFFWIPTKGLNVILKVEYPGIIPSCLEDIQILVSLKAKAEGEDTKDLLSKLPANYKINPNVKCHYMIPQ